MTIFLIKSYVIQNFFYHVGDLFYLQGDSQVQIHDVKYRNIRGTSSSKLAVAFDCSKSKPCEKIELDQINLSYHGVEGPVASSCINAKGIANGLQQPQSCI